MITDNEIYAEYGPHKEYLACGEGKGNEVFDYMCRIWPMIRKEGQSYWEEKLNDYNNIVIFPLDERGEIHGFRIVGANTLLGNLITTHPDYTCANREMFS